jgi:hypothetical protein
MKIWEQRAIDCIVEINIKIFIILLIFGINVKIENSARLCTFNFLMVTVKWSVAMIYKIFMRLMFLSKNCLDGEAGNLIQIGFWAGGSKYHMKLICLWLKFRARHNRTCQCFLCIVRLFLFIFFLANYAVYFNMWQTSKQQSPDFVIYNIYKSNIINNKSDKNKILNLWMAARHYQWRFCVNAPLSVTSLLKRATASDVFV